MNNLSSNRLNHPFLSFPFLSFPFLSRGFSTKPSREGTVRTGLLKDTTPGKVRLERICSAIQISSFKLTEAPRNITLAPFAFCQELLHVIGSREISGDDALQTHCAMCRYGESPTPDDAVCRHRRVAGTSPSAHFFPLHLPPFQIIILHHSVCTSNHAAISSHGDAERPFTFTVHSYVLHRH